MHSDNEKISKILNVRSEEIDIKSVLDKWYVELLNKTVEEITIDDISRMLRQGVLIELAVNKSIKVLKENPLAGTMYDGQLIELLYSVDVNKYSEDIEEVKNILINIKNNVYSFDWMCNEDLEEYLALLEKYLEKLNRN